MALLADMVLLLHVAFIVFVACGLLLTIVGGVVGWGWVRNRWFRGAHLAAIGFVVLQAWFGIQCPLTTLETRIRVAAGQRPYSDNGFIADWLHQLFFFRADPWVFILAYTVFGLAVVGTLALVPVDWRGRSRRGAAGDVAPPPVPGDAGP